MLAMSRVWILLSISLVLGIVTACSSLLEDDAVDTPTESAATTSPPGTPTPAGKDPTSSSGGDAATDEAATEVAGSMTATTTNSPTATSNGRVTASPTEEPLPEGGAELLIDGESITRIIPGNATGRTFYALAGDNFYRTNDGGHTWSEAGAGEFGPMIIAINEANVIYSGDKGGCGRGFSFYPFVRSSNAGRGWETVEGNADIQPLLAYESQDAAIVYGTNCGLDVSTDGGDTWRRIVELNGEDIFAISTERSAPMRQLLVVGATEGGTGRLFLFDSADSANPQFIKAVAQFWGDAALDWDDGRIVLAHAHQVGVSDDDGESWIWTRSGLEDATYSADPLFEGIPQDEIDPFRSFEFARIDPGDRDRIWIGGNRGAYLSTDGGQSWSRVGGDSPVTGLAISTVTNRVIISYDSGTRIWRLSDG